ncbi:unnamed protein product, partial [Polarella glacialis]
MRSPLWKATIVSGVVALSLKQLTILSAAWAAPAPGQEALILRPPPGGIRQHQLPESLATAAREELEPYWTEGQKKLEMMFKFGSGRRGHLRRVRGPENYPACQKLMAVAEEAFGLVGCEVCDPTKVQVMVRRYTTGEKL